VGLFSWKCRRCKAPIATPYHHGPLKAWMNRAVAVDLKGVEIARGNYDGYGRINGFELDRGEGIESRAWPWNDGPDNEPTGLHVPEIYHQACFDVLGPTKKRGPSGFDSSQGGFTKALPDRDEPRREQELDS
jgi:hypothetical protein